MSDYVPPAPVSVGFAVRGADGRFLYFSGEQHCFFRSRFNSGIHPTESDACRAYYKCAKEETGPDLDDEASERDWREWLHGAKVVELLMSPECL